MFRLKSIIIILSLVLITQNIFAQKKRSAPAKKTSPITTKKSETLAGLSDNQIYNRSINGIVIIITDCKRAGLSQGSGFIISDDLVVTNRHVVECGNVTKVKMLVSQEIFDVEGVYFHPDKDLAILRVPKLDGKDISLRLAPANTVKMDNLVYVLGNPRSIEGYFSKGNIRLVRSDNFYFDAPIAHGSSGSPVIDSQGRVVGIETTGTRLAGDRVFGGAIFSKEVGRMLPNVQKGQIANVVDKRSKPIQADSPQPTPTERQPTSGGGIGAVIGALLGIPSVTTRNDNDAPVQPKVVREPTVIRELSLEESIAEAEAKLNYSPNEALASAQKLLTRLPKDFARREPFASNVHGLIAESYIKLNQTDKAAQHILEAWKGGDFVRVKVKQIRQDKDFSNNVESRKNFVPGTFTVGNYMLVYKQDTSSVSRSFPDQSFAVKNEEMTDVEYSPATKRFSMVVKTSRDGKEIKRDFQFYPPEAVLQDQMVFGVLNKKVNCANCSDILIALIKASNDFLRK